MFGAAQPWTIKETARNSRVQPAGGHSSQKAIGETTAVIPEAGLATSPLKDGESANTNFSFAKFKAIATVGEMDAE